MEYAITKNQLYEWCHIPSSQLAEHPGRKIARLDICPTKLDTMRHVGDMMADEIIYNNSLQKITRWILPAGPLEQYDTFIERVNREKISLHNLFVFHMDEWLDWQSRPYPVQNSFNSLRGLMNAHFYDRILPELNVPIPQRIWPDIHDLDAFDNKIDEVDGIDTVWAGIGYKGLIAFCESPRDPYHRITQEEYADSKTRIVTLNEDTVIALSERECGGLSDAIPPMAVTLGFHAILSAKRAVFIITTGAWKQTVIRVLLFAEPTLEYPATLLTDRIPECILCCDQFTATHPLEEHLSEF